MRKTSLKLALALVGCSVMAQPVLASALTYTMGANTSGKGNSSASLGVTFGEGKREGSYSAQFFKLGYNYGISDALDVNMALNAYRHEYSGSPVPGEIEGSKSATQFSGAQVSLKKTLQAAKSDQLGVALYGMLKYDTIDNLSGGDVTQWEFEGKVILQQAYMDGKLQWVNNFQLEAETAKADGATDQAMTTRIRSGVSYALNNNWHVGLEGFYDFEVLKPHQQDWEFDHWDLFAGPAVAYKQKDWSAAFTLMPQLQGSDERSSGKSGLHLADHEKVNARLVVSRKF